MADPVKTVEEFKEKMDGVLSHADSVEEAKKKLKENNAMEDLNIHSLSMAMIWKMCLNLTKRRYSLWSR